VLLEGSGQLRMVDFGSSLANIPRGSTAQVMLTNTSGFTQKLGGLDRLPKWNKSVTIHLKM